MNIVLDELCFKNNKKKTLFNPSLNNSNDELENIN